MCKVAGVKEKHGSLASQEKQSDARTRGQSVQVTAVRGSEWHQDQSFVRGWDQGSAGARGRAQPRASHSSTGGQSWGSVWGQG